jgi:hypothetical protein
MMLDAQMTDVARMSAAAQPGERLHFWGTYDLGKPRTRMLLEGLRPTGVEVTEIHADVWSAHPDKAR